MKTESVPDYQQANEAAKALFESLNIQAQTSPPIADVQQNDDGKGWPNILYHVQFTRNGRNLATDYRLGVGHVKIPKGENSTMLHLSIDEQSVLYALQNNRSVTFKDPTPHVSLAAKLARVQRVSPAPHEVLAAICDDGESAQNESFDDWAGNFGYSTGSIKAKRIYETCIELYHQCNALVGTENVRKFAELHAQF